MKLLENNKHIKEIANIIEEITRLDFLYSNQQYEQMQMFINKLTQKYAIETIIWNAQSSRQATNYIEVYQYARNFLLTQGKNKLAQIGIEKIAGDKNTWANGKSIANI